jgi:hypothetical protein
MLYQRLQPEAVLRQITFASRRYLSGLPDCATAPGLCNPRLPHDFIRNQYRFLEALAAMNNAMTKRLNIGDAFVE